MTADRFDVKDKDPNFYYRWLNEKDRNMLERLEVGFELVKGKAELPPELAKDQTTENPGAGQVRRRGDLVLARIPRDVYEEKVLKPRREAAKRQATTFNTMIHQLNEQTRRDMKQAGLREDQIRAHMVTIEEQE